MLFCLVFNVCNQEKTEYEGGIWREVSHFRPEVAIGEKRPSLEYVNEYEFMKNGEMRIIRYSVKDKIDTTETRAENYQYFRFADEIYFFKENEEFKKIQDNDSILFMEHFITCGKHVKHFKVVGPDSLTLIDGFEFRKIKGQIPPRYFQKPDSLISSTWRLGNAFMLSGEGIDFKIRFKERNRITISASLENRERTLNGIYWKSGNTIFSVLSSKKDKSKGIWFENKWDMRTADVLLKSNCNHFYEFQIENGKLYMMGKELEKMN